MKTISFVIPVYNEEKRIAKTFMALSQTKLPRGLILSKVIFVNDGSSDQTPRLISNFKKRSKLGKKVTIISYFPNRGKGFAVKQGMLETKSDYTLFFDADMSTPLSEIRKFLPFFEKGIDAVIGTRKNGKSTVIIHQPKYREILGKGFTYLTKLALNLDVTDFTCGFKAFSKRSINQIFDKAIINGWGYDAEIIFLAKKYGFTISEKAVIWANDDRTKVKIYEAVPRTLLELYKIRWTHSVKPLLNLSLIPQKALFSRLTSFL